MILRYLLMFFALFSAAIPLQGTLWDSMSSYFRGERAKPSEPMIRVLLVHDVQGVNLEVRGAYSLYDPYTNSYMSTRYTGKSRNVQAMGDGLKWGEAFPGLYQLKIVPEEPQTITLINGKEYAGAIFVYDIGGTISIVNQIPIEEYVRGVLTRFQDQALEPEALYALAIVARTNAYFQAVNPKNTYWAVDAQKVGFQGIVKSNKELDRASAQTKYMIMSRTGVYEGVVTPFASQFDQLTPGQSSKELLVSKITIEEANEMAKKGDHAAQILAKAFPGTTIMMMEYKK